MDHFQAIKNSFLTIHSYFIPQMLSTEETLFRSRAIPEINSIAWIAWHILRTEDMFLNTVVYGEPQVFQSQDWGSKLGVPFSQVGTGMSREAADLVSKQVTIEGLSEYNKEVRNRSLQLVDRSVELDDDAFDSFENIDGRLKAADAFPDGVRQERASSYAKVPLASGITGITMHGFMHIGQYFSIAKPL